MQQTAPNPVALPQSWNDLSGSQMAEACRILYAKGSRKEKTHQLVGTLVGSKDIHLLDLSKEVLDRIAFFFQTPNRSRPPFECLRLGHFGRVFPPSCSLDQISIGEWTMADQAFEAYLKRAEEKYLNQLCACIYRPRKMLWEMLSQDFNGSSREKAKVSSMEEEARQWESVDLGVKLSIMLFFASHKEQMAHAFPKLFKKIASRSQARGNQWMGRLRSFNHKLDKYEQVLKGHLHTMRKPSMRTLV